MVDKPVFDFLEEEGPRLAKWGIKSRRAFRTWRNRVRARKNEPLKEGGMLNGKKTYLGIAAVAVGLVLSWFGIGECSPADVAAAVCESAEALSAKIIASVDQILQVGGLLLAAYGRSRAQPSA